MRIFIQRHTLLAFVGLTFARSWSLWRVQALFIGADPISARWLGIITSYGPTLAAAELTARLPSAAS
jgi:hypothetical protein